MKKILLIFCGIAAVFFVTLGCSAESSDVLTVTPTVDGNILKYSVETEFNTDEVWIFSALYDGEVLSDVRVNTLNGEFEMQPDREYELKVFTWEKDSMKPISNVVSFKGLKSGGESPTAPPKGDIKLPGDEIEEIPQNYYSSAEYQGTLEDFIIHGNPFRMKNIHRNLQNTLLSICHTAMTAARSTIFFILCTVDGAMKIQRSARRADRPHSKM